MQTQSTGKKKQLIIIILGLVCIVLGISVLFLYRQNIELKRELNKIAPLERSQTELNEQDKSTDFKADNSSPKLEGISEDMNDKEKIKKLESIITDMQAWQDYLEESIKKEKIIEDDNKEMMHNILRKAVSSQLDSFIEEEGLAPEIVTKLSEIFIEKNDEEQDSYSEDTPYEERQKELESIDQKYDEKVSRLLGEHYGAYKDYMKVQDERSYIANFKNSMLTGDNKLEKQQEKRLITAIYNDNQIMKEREKEGKMYGNLSDAEKSDKNLEIIKMRYRRYIDSARNILSESQLQKFQKYLDGEMSRREMRINRRKSQAANREKKENDQ